MYPFSLNLSLYFHLENQFVKELCTEYDLKSVLYWHKFRTKQTVIGKYKIRFNYGIISTTPKYFRYLSCRYHFYYKVSYLTLLYGTHTPDRTTVILNISLIQPLQYLLILFHKHWKMMKTKVIITSKVAQIPTYTHL